MRVYILSWFMLKPFRKTTQPVSRSRWHGILPREVAVTTGMQERKNEGSAQVSKEVDKDALDYLVGTGG